MEASPSPIVNEAAPEADTGRHGDVNRMGRLLDHGLAGLRSPRSLEGHASGSKSR